MEKISDILRKTRQEHSTVGRIHLHHTCIVLADSTRNLRILQEDRSRNLVEGYLVDENLIICIIITLHHINFLLYCLVDFLNLLSITPYRDGIFVDVLDTASRHIQALDIYLSSCKYSGNLIQDTGNILRIDKQCI